MERESGSIVRELHFRDYSGKKNQNQITNVKSPTASNWNYGKWLMGKSMEELEIMPTTDKPYMKVIEGKIDQVGESMKSIKLGERNF